MTTVKCIFRCAATVIIAVLLASPFPESSVLPWNNTCLHPHTVRTDTHGMSAVPPLVLWAWERPEDLRFLDPTRVGVAFLAQRVRLGPKGVSYYPRMQPLRVAQETSLVAVVRVETAAGAARDPETARRVGGEIARAGRPPRGGGAASGLRCDHIAADVLSQTAGGTEAAVAFIDAEFDHRTHFLVHR